MSKVTAKNENENENKISPKKFVQNNVWSNKIVTTPPQPQLNSKGGVGMKMTLHHPPHKLHVLHISAVPDAILTKL